MIETETPCRLPTGMNNSHHPAMIKASPRSQPDFNGLPNMTFRQLEVFRLVCREESYANAAIELHSTRANVKRVCEDFEKVVGRPLFTEGSARELSPTPFARELIGQMSPLSRGLRTLGETVRNLHQEGRVLRFAAAGELFRGGLFTDFLARLQISDRFRPCFLRVEPERCRTALLNAECDVYFGAGIGASDRLDQIHLAPIDWQIEPGASFKGPLPSGPEELPSNHWWITEGCDPESAAALLAEFQSRGAVGGRILSQVQTESPSHEDIVLRHDTTVRHSGDQAWPTYRFSALIRKHHPYTELLPRLQGAAIS